MAKTPSPPYTSVSDVDAFFERVERIAEPKPPKKVDSGWVQNFGFETAHFAALPSMLRWLGVINDDLESTGIWDKLRVDATRQETLQKLVKDGYKGIFDAVDVEQASASDLRGAFVSAYSVGDSARHIKCFLSLCQHAGITTAVPATQAREKAKDNGAPKPKPKPAASERPAKPAETPKPAKQTSGVSLSLNIEIPADWTEEQIRERLATVTRAAGQVDS